MTTPMDEPSEPAYSLPAYNITHQTQERSSDEEGTIVNESNESQEHEPTHGDGQQEVYDEKHAYEEERTAGEDAPIRKRRDTNLLMVDTDFDREDPLKAFQSPSQTREQAHRLDDELAMLKIERQVSQAAESNDMEQTQSRMDSIGRSRSRRDDTLDEFDVATNPIHEKTAIYKPPAHPVGKFSKMVKRVHNSSWLIRYVTYITPVVLILLIPLLLGALLFKDATVGNVELVWFMVWLEIVWLTLWAGRLLAKALPWPIGLVSSLFTNNSKKWRDMGKALELPATLFFWWLGIEVSFLPTMKHHQHNTSVTQEWMTTMNKVLVALFVGAIINFVEKIIIQLIAISFHLRTYADRIELNKFQIGSLTKLYTFSKEKIAMEDSEFENPSGPGSGARTPGRYMHEAQKTTVEAMRQFGDVAGKIAGDFTGRKVSQSTHPHQVILTLLHSTPGSQVLARRLYRTFAREETETVHSEDLKNAFDNDEEAEAAFTMFDKDMNGDISMEELESVCVEIGRERKSITASLKDLDSVVGKLDDFLMFIVALITLLVFISLISTSAAGVLTSLGSTVLALSWLLSATAQEFLQSCIFVFVKHPFDVGDRVSIYGNTGSLLKGDDYFVKEIALLYTEFKKMEGHVVQAPNSYLNTLFILNQRRSGGLAEAVSITIKFGTTLDQIDGLRLRLLEFVRQEKREFQGNILTELRDIVEAHSLNLNVVFFYKSNWQNEGLRLARRNKFICAMMVTMQELNIEGPRMRFPGMKESFPMYLQQIPHMATAGAGHGGHPDNPSGWQPDEPSHDPPFVSPLSPHTENPYAKPPTPVVASGGLGNRKTSILRSGSQMRPRGESLSAMNRRVDFSLGMNAMASGDLGGDVFEDRNRGRVPIEVTSPSHSRSRPSQESNTTSHDDLGRTTSLASEFNPGRLARRSTDNQSTASRSHQPVHRNRFFSRHRASTLDQDVLMENGMADIPEGNAESAQMSRANSGRLDPRSGLVSSAAWRMNSNEPNIGASGRTSLEQAVRRSFERAAPPGRMASLDATATEDFELRRAR